ncbi:acyltransferase [Calothrix membranacea FACHB-236]|nr:acyltransferase [Calothrix membranacea FACHB-236]
MRGLWGCLRNGVKYNAHNIPRLGKRVIFQVEPGGQLILLGKLTVDRDAEIIVYQGGQLILGDDVYIGHNSTIACAHKITIGNRAMIADFVTIRDMNHIRISGIPINQSGIQSSPIDIGDDCWLASKVTVTAGTSIGNEVTVGANAVVIGQHPSHCLLAGIPAQLKKFYHKSENREKH